MKTYYLDLHIHVGRSCNGKPVKITASKDLTLTNILEHSLNKKGLDIIGVVDCASVGVLEDLKDFLNKGDLYELPSGGLCYKDRLTVFTGVELEAKEASGKRAHYLAFFPTIALLEEFSHFIWSHLKNPQLSTQASYLPASILLDVVTKGGGKFIPAHVFTPHKSLLGSCAESLAEVFHTKSKGIEAIELGLSADSKMASYLPDLKNKVFLANSDAHSLDKIGREYNQVSLKEANFQEFEYLLAQEKGRRIIAHYGLDPGLGKYHRSYCNRCEKAIEEEPPIMACPLCGEREHFVCGVLDRVLALRAKKIEAGFTYDVPYIYQIPLSFLPGLGKKTKEKLLAHFQTEMNVLHQASYAELKSVVGHSLARLILQSRTGELSLSAGAGGHYGRIRE